jgi:hypothetical protein
MDASLLLHGLQAKHMATADWWLRSSLDRPTASNRQELLCCWCLTSTTVDASDYKHTEPMAFKLPLTAQQQDSHYTFTRCNFNARMPKHPCMQACKLAAARLQTKHGNCWWVGWCTSSKNTGPTQPPAAAMLLLPC